jgi:hypothetical protein
MQAKRKHYPYRYAPKELLRTKYLSPYLPETTDKGIAYVYDNNHVNIFKVYGSFFNNSSSWSRFILPSKPVNLFSIFLNFRTSIAFESRP